MWRFGASCCGQCAGMCVVVSCLGRLGVAVCLEVVLVEGLGKCMWWGEGSGLGLERVVHPSLDAALHGCILWVRPPVTLCKQC